MNSYSVVGSHSLNTQANDFNCTLRLSHTFGIEDLRNKMAQIEDGDIMIETLALTEKYTGQRKTDQSSATTLRNLLQSYRPTWHYQTGKEGYECSFCKKMSKDHQAFYLPESHKANCPYIAANLLLEEPHDNTRSNH